MKLMQGAKAKTKPYGSPLLRSFINRYQTARPGPSDASNVAFGLTSTAHADLRYYIDQDVLRKNDAPTLLHRAMLDIGSNPIGWSHRWCGRQMVSDAGPTPGSEAV